MSKHRPECRWESQRCICAELRLCEDRVRNEIAVAIALAHQRATYDPHGRAEGCEDCNIWYTAWDIAMEASRE